LILISITTARDVIKVDAKYQHLIDHLLQNVVIINEELDDLRHITATDDLVLLSKSGRFTRKKSMVSGGSVGLFEGKKIGRKKNLEKLQKLISSKENELNKIEEKLAKKQGDLKILQENKHEGDLSLKQAELNQYQRSKVQLDTQIQNYLRMQSEQNEKIQLAESQMDTASRGIVDNEDLTITLRAEMKAVDKLKNRLANFGEINPMAVEAFNEMSERYESISSQRQDIINAKDSLLETIKEIEDTATKQFMEAFEQIRENFINVFRSLFSEEDNCNLILEDEENPLESKIEIIAKPKGKKPKSLSQLSGGEKTLTATALLFALYLLKPAPFCIFDEVDAPLDDANIQKFNKIIKKFSKESQFIIVTHNKSTMAAVDVLYGVYMQQQGVSGVSAVDFRNYEHEEILKAVG